VKKLVSEDRVEGPIEKALLFPTVVLTRGCRGRLAGSVKAECIWWSWFQFQYGSQALVAGQLLADALEVRGTRDARRRNDPSRAGRS
jgi:hypothetical protein